MSQTNTGENVQEKLANYDEDIKKWIFILMCESACKISGSRLLAMQAKIEFCRANPMESKTVYGDTIFSDFQAILKMPECYEMMQKMYGYWKNYIGWMRNYSKEPHSFAEGMIFPFPKVYDADEEMTSKLLDVYFSGRRSDKLTEDSEYFRDKAKSMIEPLKEEIFVDAKEAFPDES